MRRKYEDFLDHINSGVPPNTILNYYGTDSPEVWFKTNNQEIIEERKKTYIYKYNDHGFRCDDFCENSEFPIVFLGCSFTAGVALEIEQTWPNLLLDKIRFYMNKRIPLWNLALSGASIDKQALVLTKYYDLLKPKLIFFLIPSMYRRNICLNDEIIDYLPSYTGQSWRPDDLTNKVKKFDPAFIEEDYALFESFKNLFVINQMAKLHQSKVYWESWTEESSYRMLKTLCDQLSQFENLSITLSSFERDLARDSSHPGPITNRNFAIKVFDKVKTNLQSFL